MQLFSIVTKYITTPKFGTSLLDHMSTATIYTLSKCKRGTFLHHWKYTFTNI